LDNDNETGCVATILAFVYGEAQRTKFIEELREKLTKEGHSPLIRFKSSL